MTAMQELKHFTRALHVLLLMGFTGFAIAAESPGAMLLGVSFTLIHAVLERLGVKVTLPRSVASALAVAMILFVGAQIVRGEMTALLGFSYLLLVLIFIKLFDVRSNRDIAQTLVMSLLLMTAGAVSSANVLFGAIFIVYLLMGLYVSLLLHLKSETDRAVASLAIPRDRVSNPQADAQRALRRSIRQVTALVAAIALVVGLAVFLFFPRSQATAIAAAAFRPSQSATALTGFSEHVSFDQVARITQNTDVVAHVRLTRQDQPYTPPAVYWRGTTLSVYSGDMSAGLRGRRWQWFHAPASRDPELVACEASVPWPLYAGAQPGDIEQDILLQPTGSQVLFSMAGPSTIASEQPLRLIYDPADQSVKDMHATRGSLRYRLTCSGQLGQPPAAVTQPAPSPGDGGLWIPGLRRNRGIFRWLPMTSRIDPRTTDYARQPNVSGRDSAGIPLVELRTAATGPDPLDETIARNIEHHLQSTFAYTLDLTDVSRDAQQDPIVGFLYDTKRGHCEYFAGAMTLMCQSLGMQARMVIGFRFDASDLNHLGDYYVVRQSHAHAWVEVLTPQGWVSFDPTSGRSAPAKPPSLAGAGDLWDYIQYKWASTVVAYDDQNRRDLLEDISAGVQRTSSWGSDTLQSLQSLFMQPDQLYKYSTRILGGAIIFFILLGFVAVGGFLTEKYRLRQRAERIGLNALPDSDQLRLARQLAFYDQLLQVLQRHNISRPRSLTPREFAQSLTFLPATAYEHVRRLTSIFYRVRFGQQNLPAAQQRRLLNAVSELSEMLQNPQT